MYSFVALGCTGTSEYTKFSISARTDLPVRVNLPVDLNLALDGPKNSDFKYLQVIILNLVSLPVLFSITARITDLPVRVNLPVDLNLALGTI